MQSKKILSGLLLAALLLNPADYSLLKANAEEQALSSEISILNDETAIEEGEVIELAETETIELAETESIETAETESVEAAETESVVAAADATDIPVQEEEIPVSEAAAEEDEDENSLSLTEKGKQENNLSEGKISIRIQNASITLQGVMPCNAQASAEAVEVELEGKKVLAAYDITIYDEKKKVYQPQEGAISVAISNIALEEAISSGAEISVYHMEDENAAPTEIEEVSSTESGITFEAESFSVYVVTIPETHYTYTCNFYDSDRTTLLNVQILSAGETLSMPVSPAESSAYIFQGWYTQDGEKFTDFGRTVTQADLAQGSLVQNLYAEYRTSYYVFYMDGNAKDSNIIYTQTYSDGDRIDTSDIPAATVNTEKGLQVGWSRDPYAQTAEQNIAISGADITLYPVYADTLWIIYDTQGGTVVEPTCVFSGEKPVAPDAPTKTGYLFNGWYQDKECTTAFSFENTMTENITLYAGWEPAMTQYTVIFWTQQLTDDKDAGDDEKSYDYDSSEIRTALTGSTVSITQEDTRRSTSAGWIYNAQKQTTEVVKGDGSTVLNVYYDRLYMTYGFYDGKNDATPVFTMTGLFGQPFSLYDYVWPEDGIWYCTTDNGRYELTIDEVAGFGFVAEGTIYACTGSDIRFYTGSGVATTTESYLEQLDGSWKKVFTGKVQQSNRVLYGFGNTYNGFTVSFYSWDNDQWIACEDGETIWKYAKDTLYIRHSRNSYALDYINGSEGVVKTESIKYETFLEDFADYVPQRPSDLEEYYVFKGWYKDPTCTEPFDFKRTMPSNNLVVYAKWAPMQVTVTFDSDGGSEIEGSPFTINMGEQAEKPEDPVRDGYLFAGWMRNEQAFHFETRIMADTVLTAQWIRQESYTLIYDPGYAAGEQITGDGSYMTGAGAKLSRIGDDWGWSAPENSDGFTGWNTQKDGSGETYYPGDIYTITGENDVLYAQWTYGRRTILTYDYNGGMDGDGNASAQTVISVPNGAYMIDRDGKTVSRDGYIFAGWTIAKDWNGDRSALLQAGDNIQIDSINANTNVLYAQWIEEVKESTVTKTSTSRGVPLENEDAAVTKMNAAEEKVLLAADPVSSEKKPGKTPATGDDTDISLYILLTAAALLIIAKIRPVHKNR